MPDVHVMIDGTEVAVAPGTTVLKAAEAAGIEIPTLCAHPALGPIGACRMCLVEVEKQRVLQPACTFPVYEGMVVHTKSANALEAHRFVLQLLFSERNHFCMFCQMSGSCELQRLAYEHGIDHWEYDRAFPKLPVDASRKFFAMDHNRCVLCRRCVRACDELVGNNTLGIKNRGAESMIIADLDVPFGESSCVSCGTCLQVCPTGALMDRASAFMGQDDEITRVKSRCMACSVGCGVELIVRDNRVIRIEGDWDADPNRGLLCEIGRFHPLHESRRRVRKPLVKDAGGLRDATWEEALERVAARFKVAGDSLLTLVSGFASTEEAKALLGLPGEKASMSDTSPAGCCCTSSDDCCSSSSGSCAPDHDCCASSEDCCGSCDCDSAPLSALDEADLFVVVSTDLTKDFQVAGFAIKRGVSHRGARLLLLDEEANGLDPWALKKWSPTDAKKALEIAAAAEMPAIVFGPGGCDVAMALAEKLPKAVFVSFAAEGNALGIVAAGIDAPFTGQRASAYYLLASETPAVDDALLGALQQADFVVVQSSFREPWAEVADVILPAPTTSEKNGTMINAEGRVGQIVAGVKTKLPSGVDTIERIKALLSE